MCFPSISAGTMAAMVWVRRAMTVALVALAIHLLLPQIGGIHRDAQALKEARPAFLGLAVLLEVASLTAYVLLYRTVLRAAGVDVRTSDVGRVTMASFFVSHLLPGGAATGSVVNVDGLRSRSNVPATTAGLALGLTVLISDAAMVGLFVVGIAYSLTQGANAGGYLATAAIAVPFVIAVLGVTVVAAYHPTMARRIGHLAGRIAHRFRHTIDPEKIAEEAHDLSEQACRVLRGRAAVEAVAFATANWLCDLLVLYTSFLALGQHQHLGAVIVAYAVANMLAAIPLTPAGLGVIEASLVAVSVPFGSSRQVAVLAVLGYRLINYWLPLPFAAAAYVTLRQGISKADVGGGPPE